MSKFKIGDKVVVVDADSAYDNYFNGDIGIVTSFDQYCFEACFVERMGDGLSMNVYFTEIEHFKEKEVTAEQIRDEIIRIDLRIEEAKKDIESAEKERNSLVEKLRKMGFEMLEQGVPDTRRPEVGDEVVVIGYSEAHHDCDYTGLVGTLDHDDRTARPYKVFLDKTGQSHWFAENEIKKI